MRTLVLMTFASLVGVGGCVAEMAIDEVDGGADEVSEAQQALYSDIGGVGTYNGVEWQIDVPWRLEPSADPALGPVTYDAIPLVFTIADVSLQPDRVDLQNDVMPIRRFCGLYVLEVGDDPARSPVTSSHRRSSMKSRLSVSGSTPGCPRADPATFIS